VASCEVFTQTVMYVHVVNFWKIKISLGDF